MRTTSPPIDTVEHQRRDHDAPRMRVDDVLLQVLTSIVLTMVGATSAIAIVLRAQGHPEDIELPEGFVRTGTVVPVTEGSVQIRVDGLPWAGASGGHRHFSS